MPSLGCRGVPTYNTEASEGQPVLTLCESQVPTQPSPATLLLPLSLGGPREESGPGPAPKAQSLCRGATIGTEPWCLREFQAEGTAYARAQRCKVPRAQVVNLSGD